MVEEKVGEEQEKEEKRPVAIAAGQVSPKQMEEIEAGECYTVGQLASHFQYSRAWISYHCKTGRIKAVKPIGGQWRIPKSEYERLIKEKSIPGLPREPKKKPVVGLEMPEGRVAKVADERSKEQPRRGWSPLDFIIRRES